VPAASIDAVNAAHASVIQLRKDRRGTDLASLAAAAGAAGFAAGGLGATGGGAVGLGSSLLIGVVL